ncbi:MAG: hypothetical protein SH868_13595 [Bythopirellula sp.]|nr:hypothetical protein [Bythopirellula sp.]
MSPPDRAAQASLRWGVYAILITLAVGNMTGRLQSVNSINRIDLENHVINRELQKIKQQLQTQNLAEEEITEQLAAARVRIAREHQLQRPFLSANDRSRWLAIRALVELGTYEIDSLIDRDVWNTIDMVQHSGDDGELHLYSSKPPLLITLLAGEYWVIHKLTGMTLAEHPYFVGRLMLFTVNILPLAWMLVIVAQLAERFGKTDWARIFVVATACFGTLLTTFAVVLNNHIIAAVSAAIAFASFARIWCDGSTRTRDYAACGLAAAFTAANELPALAMFALMALALLTRDRRAWLVGFLPPALVIALASFGTNYAAHGTLSPPYAHRSTAKAEDNWYQYKYTVEGVELESYWANRQGIDRGEESKLTYGWHCLFGHHGVFSLTPVWLLSMAGLIMWWRSAERAEGQIALGIAVLTIVCLTFFLALRPLEDRNYGGMTSGFRWMFWFAPLWLWAMLPAVDRLAASRTGKAFCLVLLLISVLSASYPTWNPWTHPWIFNGMESLGWMGS